MICILHGYLLEGSGSNLWTRSIIQSLCRAGETVHLVCQENHPDLYDFISTVYHYQADGSHELKLQREVPYEGQCIMHKPHIGNILPVYVWDRYEEFTDVRPMAELDEEQIENYIQHNVRVLRQIVAAHGIRAIHANHAVLMSVVARRVSQEMAIPFSIMPHGSAIEYAVKKKQLLYDLARDAFAGADRIFVIGQEIRQRVTSTFPDIPELESKMVDLNLGVDTRLFKLIPRERRAETAETLCSALAGVPRGKKPGHRLRLLSGLSPDIGKKELLTLMAENSDYNAKHTDHDVESRLRSIDWRNDRLILFVGRLIAAKGVHQLFFALPSILQNSPDVKLIVVGHGPMREPLEVLVWALANGATSLVENIVGWGTELEGSGQDPFEDIGQFLAGLKTAGRLDGYYESTRKTMNEGRVIFTGYLTHRELQYLFPICDTAVFPSVVAEAGPLVFLEAMASGCFPIGTYFAGMAASIDSVTGSVPDEVVANMKLNPDKKETVNNIVTKVIGAMSLDESIKDSLRDISVKKYDWQSVSRRFLRVLQDLGR